MFHEPGRLSLSGVSRKYSEEAQFSTLCFFLYPQRYFTDYGCDTQCRTFKSFNYHVEDVWCHTPNCTQAAFDHAFIHCISFLHFGSKLLDSLKDLFFINFWVGGASINSCKYLFKKLSNLLVLSYTST